MASRPKLKAKPLFVELFIYWLFETFTLDWLDIVGWNVETFYFCEMFYCSQPSTRYLHKENNTSGQHESFGAELRNSRCKNTLYCVFSHGHVNMSPFRLCSPEEALRWCNDYVMLMCQWANPSCACRHMTWIWRDGHVCFKLNIVLMNLRKQSCYVQLCFLVLRTLIMWLFKMSFFVKG